MDLEVATPADAPALAALVNAAYRAIGGGRGWTSEADLFAGGRVRAPDVAAMIAGGGTVLLRRSAQSLVGCIAIEADGAEAVISMLAVDPARQASGLGRALLAEAEQWAGRQGARLARMTVVEPRTELVAWYERRGYRRTGVEDFPYGDDRVGRPLRDDLRFVVLEKSLA